MVENNNFQKKLITTASIATAATVAGVAVTNNVSSQ